MVAGVLTLACYGVVVNVVPWNFSRITCAYIAFFTLITFSWRQFILGQKLPKVIWLGVASRDRRPSDFSVSILSDTRWKLWP